MEVQNSMFKLLDLIQLTETEFQKSKVYSKTMKTFLYDSMFFFMLLTLSLANWILLSNLALITTSSDNFL